MVESPALAGQAPQPVNALLEEVTRALERRTLSGHGDPQRSPRLQLRRGAARTGGSAPLRLRGGDQAPALPNSPPPRRPLRVRGATDCAPGSGSLPAVQGAGDLCRPAQARRGDAVRLGVRNGSFSRASRRPAVPLLSRVDALVPARGTWQGVGC